MKKIVTTSSLVLVVAVAAFFIAARFDSQPAVAPSGQPLATSSALAPAEGSGTTSAPISASPATATPSTAIKPETKPEAKPEAKPVVPKPEAKPAGPAAYSLAEIARHDQPADCWLIVGGKVYGVSSYLAEHPGGAGVITPYCGRDATEAFRTKGGEGEHSAGARDLLGQHYLGQAVQ